MSTKGAISNFIEKYYLHFNAATVVDAAKAYEDQLNNGAKMLVSLGYRNHKLARLKVHECFVSWGFDVDELYQYCIDYSDGVGGKFWTSVRLCSMELFYCNENIFFMQYLKVALVE